MTPAQPATPATPAQQGPGPVPQDLTGRTIVVTGASSGIGRVAATRLAERGADVAVVGRNPERTRSVAASVKGTAFLADFDRLDDVRRLATQLLDRYARIDVLVNNAGGLVSKRVLTDDGHERTFQSNHLAPFLLTNLLLPRLIEAAAMARVISTASVANRIGALRLDDLDWEKRAWNGGWPAYGTSKLATILFMRELAERLHGREVAAYSVHPGYVSTSFGATSPLMKFANMLPTGNFGISAEAGAMPLIQLAGSAVVGAPSGSYFDRLTPSNRMNKQARDTGLGRELWNVSARLVGLPLD